MAIYNKDWDMAIFILKEHEKKIYKLLTNNNK